MKRFRIDNKYEYCPNGNYWTDMSGIFDTRIYLYCGCKKCNGKVYTLRPVDVTKKIRQESIDRHIRLTKLDEVRSSINLDNMDKVVETINRKPLQG